MVRNALIAAGNSGLPGLVPRVRLLLDDPAPVVRGAAIWALARLYPESLPVEHAARVDREVDPAVLAEWDLALAGDSVAR